MAHLDQITSGPPSAIAIPRSMVQEHGCKTEAEAVRIIEGYTNAESEAELDQIRRDELEMLEKRVRWKVDLRLCSIAGILCSLNLVDSGILSSAAVTSMLKDLGLDQGSRYSVSIFIFTLSSVAFQLPCTIAVRSVGPRVWFASITILFGVLTLCTAFVQDWQQMIVLRVLLGAAMSGIYPGLTYLISAWYPRKEQQLRFAFLQSGEVVGLATGTLVNYGVANLDGVAGFADWRWMFIVQGLISFFLGYITYWWMIDFPENSHHSFCFLSEREANIAVHRIQVDRKDAILEPFSWSRVLRNFSDFKVYGFGCMFFLLNLVSTSLSYFLPTILNGLGFNSRQAILLATPPYYWAVLPVTVTSLVADRYRVRAPLIVFNSLVLIAGFLMLGLPASTNLTVRYAGTFLATGAYVSNWAALNAFMANNVAGQWKRAVTAATVSAFNGLGGVAGSFIVRQEDAPKYLLAIWVSVGSHILLIFIVGAFTLYFYIANRQQGMNTTKIEGIAGFRYTY